MEAGEVVEAIVCGQYQGHDGVAVLTNRRLVVANSRTFAPEIDSLSFAELSDVKGWAESGKATLRFSGGPRALVLGDIAEVDAAQTFAGALRSKI